MVKFIADIGANHNGDLKRVLEIIYTSHYIGCWAVKPQFYDADKLFRGPSPIPKEWEFKYEWFPTVRAACTELGLKLGVSVFHPSHVEMVKPFADYLKISSFDILREDLIDACIKAELPIHISCGMGMPDLGKFTNTKVVLYHCVSEYPARIEHTNIQEVNYFPGYSDHTKSPGVIHRAAAYGAEYIEFHLDFDGSGWEYKKSDSCWLPWKIENVINDVRDGEKACEPYNFPEEYYMQKADPIDGLRPMMRRI